VKKLRISCTVIVKNMAKTIEQCLSSLIAEEIDEIVVVDGNSNDGTSEIIDRFPVIHLYDNGKGLPAARNIGLRACTGKYVMIIDGDQYISKGFGKCLREILMKEKYDAIICKEEWIGNSIWSKAQQASWSEVDVLKKGWCYQPRVIRKALMLEVGGYDETFKGFEDRDLWKRIEKLSPKIYNSNLLIFNDASDLTLLSALKRGIYSYVSMIDFIRKYPSAYLAVVSVFPIGLIIDAMISLRIALKTKDVTLAIATFALRVTMSMGRLIGVIIGTPLGRILTISKKIREIARIPTTIE